MKICVTGGAGFIGSHIAEECVTKGYEVIVFDNFSTGKKENLSFVKNYKNARLKIIKGDVADFNALKEVLKGCNAVFHQAAVASVQKSIECPPVTFESNAKGTLNVLEASRVCGVKKIIFACSAAIFGDHPEIPKREDSPVLPKSPYGADKYISEVYLRLYNELYNLTTVSLRYFNVFGPRQDPSSPYSGVISIFTSRIAKGQNITVYGDGKQYRDFIFVKDVVQANMLALEKIDSGFHYYNVGYGKATDLNTLIALLQKVYQKDIMVNYAEARAGDIIESVSDPSKIMRELGFLPAYTVEEGLKILVESLG
ncbi:MAG: SDR family NAD(P)-dependent oxidoreductase [Spirochaetes bacterium]|nr:SDR family NAD(P)-dependent oxidoreductase [Spirochaetota bacterium]